MLSNAYFLAKFRLGTAENELAKNLQNFAKICKMLIKFANFVNFASFALRASASGRAPPPAPVAGRDGTTTVSTRRGRRLGWH